MLLVQMIICASLFLRGKAFPSPRRPSVRTPSPWRRLMSSEDAQNFVEECLPRAWRSIGLRNVMGGEEEHDEAFRTMFRETLKEFGNGVSEEVRFNVAMDEGDWRKMPIDVVLERYERHRATSTGVTPCMAFACLFKPLPAEVYRDDDFRELLRIASLICGVDNDLQSQNKEGDWDRVSILVRVGEYSMDDAIEANCRRHHELEGKYERVATKLAQRYPEIQAWSDLVGPTIFRGFVSWQAHVKRYRNDDDRSLLERLFAGQPYHVIQPDGTFDGLDLALHTELNRDALDWVKESGLLASEAKFEAMNPALCTLLLYDYYTAEDVAALKAFTKFFLCLVVADDFWEKPEFHALTKEVMFDSFDNDL